MRRRRIASSNSTARQSPTAAPRSSESQPFGPCRPRRPPLVQVCNTGNLPFPGSAPQRGASAMRTDTPTSPAPVDDEPGEDIDTAEPDLGSSPVGASLERSGGRRSRARGLLVAVLLCALVPSAVVLTLWRNLTEPFWFNEQWRAYYISNPGNWWEALKSNGAPFPAGWYFLERISGVLFGSTELVLRLPTALFLPIGCVLLMLLACGWMSTPAAVVVALVGALTGTLVSYAYQVSEYQLDAAAVVAVVLLREIAWEADRPTWRWAGSTWATEAWPSPASSARRRSSSRAHSSSSMTEAGTPPHPGPATRGGGHGRRDRPGPSGGVRPPPGHPEDQLVLGPAVPSPPRHRRPGRLRLGRPARVRQRRGRRFRHSRVSRASSSVRGGPGCSPSCSACCSVFGVVEAALSPARADASLPSWRRKS